MGRIGETDFPHIYALIEHWDGNAWSLVPNPGTITTGTPLYGVAATDGWGADPDRLRTTYCYLRTDGPAELVSVDWDRSMLDRTRAELDALLERVAAGDYAVITGPWCGGCDFRASCAAGTAWLEANSPD